MLLVDIEASNPEAPPAVWIALSTPTAYEQAWSSERGPNPYARSEYRLSAEKVCVPLAAER
jgi:hypothetical protein